MWEELLSWKWDLAALGTLGATLLGWLPAVATLLTIVWYLVKLYDRFTKGREDAVARQPDSKPSNDKG